MLNLDSFSWLKSRASSIIDICTEWTAGRYDPYNMVRSIGGQAYKNLLGIVCMPSLEVHAIDSQNNVNGIPSGFTFTRASNATAFGPNGLMYTAGTNELRHEWDPNTGEYKGWLIEGASTNFLTYSQDLSQSVWSKNNVTATLDTTSFLGPDFTTYRLTEASDTATQKNFRVSNITVTSGTVFTVSIFVKPDSNRMGYTIYPFYSGNGCVTDFNLETQTSVTTAVGTGSGTANILDCGNGVFRLSVTVTLPTATTLISVYQYFSDTASNGNASYDGDGVSGISVSGIQCESGYIPSSYIPTTTASATRDNDLLKILTSAFPFNATEGTMYVEFSLPLLGTTNSRYPLSLDADTSSYAIYIRIRDDLVDQLTFYATNSTTVGYFGYDVTILPNASYRAVIAYKLDDYAGTCNNVSLNTDTSATVPAVTNLKIGQIGSVSYLNALNGHVTHVLYFPKRLSNTELQLLTS